MLRRILLAALVCALWPAAAHAEIYSWRDASGTLVLSDKPKSPDARTYAVEVHTAAPAVAAFRTTSPLIQTRAARFDSLIDEHSTRHSLDPNFVRAVIQAESAFNPRARSPKGAMGLMQLMPETASEYGVVNAYDPGENIRAGVTYLKSLLTRFDGDESLALAAYNAGPGAVEKYGRTVPPYKETRAYVAKIRANVPGIARASAASPKAATVALFRTVDVVNGREVVRYSNKASHDAELVVPAAIR